MHELNQQIHTGVIGCNHVIRQQEINGNTQTVDNLYQLVQCKTSLAALDLSESGSVSGALREFFFLMHDSPYVYLPFDNELLS